MLAKVSQWLCASLKKSEAPVFGFAKAKFTLRFCPLVVGVWTDPDVPHTEYNEGVLFWYCFNNLLYLLAKLLHFVLGSRSIALENSDIVRPGRDQLVVYGCTSEDGSNHFSRYEDAHVMVMSGILPTL